MIFDLHRAAGNHQGNPDLRLAAGRHAAWAYAVPLRSCQRKPAERLATFDVTLLAPAAGEIPHERRAEQQAGGYSVDPPTGVGC